MSNIEVTRAKVKMQILKSANVSRLIELADRISTLVEKKNHDYGNSWQRYGIFTPLIRINDKILRVKTLASGETALVADENIKDTLEDIIGYAALALQWLEENNDRTI